MRRNLLSSVLIEVLQVLKHIYKEQRRITPSRASPINEPFSLGKTDELLDLLRSIDEPNNGT